MREALAAPEPQKAMRAAATALTEAAAGVGK